LTIHSRTCYIIGSEQHRGNDRPARARIGTGAEKGNGKTERLYENGNQPEAMDKRWGGGDPKATRQHETTRTNNLSSDHLKRGLENASPENINYPP